MPERTSLDKKYLYYLVKKRIDVLKSKIHGSTMKHITKKDFVATKISLPSVKNQKKIVSILEKAEQLKQWRKEADYLADEYLKSVFYEMFGDPKENPNRWTKTNINEISTKVTDGEHTTPKRTESGIKLLSARNIKNGYIDFKEEVDYISNEEYERIKKRCNPEIGDILMTCSGTIGRVTVVNINEPMSMVRSVALVKLRKDLINPFYLENYFQTKYFQSEIIRYTHTSNQSNLFTGQIKKLPVILPPYEKQKIFSDISKSITTLKEFHKNSRNTIDNLFNCLIQRAFKGELIT